MQGFNRIGKRILFPPLWLIMLLTVISTVTLVMIFINGWDKHPIACGFYGVACYTLTIVVLFFWKVWPTCYKTIINKVYSNKYANRYMTDVAYRTQVGLYISLSINLMYVALNAIWGFVYKTHWFGIFAAYYGILAIMRFLLLRYVHKNPIGKNYLGELRRARLCAVILLTVNLVLSGAVLMMAYYDRGFQYQGILIYVIATYTFYITTTAIIDMIKYRKYKRPVLSITKVIKMASALFSMLFLETAMFAQFGKETPPEMKKMMILLTGAVISIVLVSMGAYMIIKTSKEINQTIG